MAWEPEEILITRFEQEFLLSPGELRSFDRHQDIARVRHLAIYAMREVGQLSLLQIASIMNRGDHTTIMNSVARAENLLKEPLLAKRYEAAVEAARYKEAKSGRNLHNQIPRLGIKAVLDESQRLPGDIRG